MAPRVEYTFGVSMDSLMRMQNSDDIEQMRKRKRTVKVGRPIAVTPETACRCVGVAASGEP